MALVAGIDIGSAYSKAVILNETALLAHCIIPSRGNYAAIAEEVFSETLAKARVTSSELEHIIATGIGAPSAPFACLQVADMSCQGRGVHHLFPSVRTIIDVGGQSSKVIKINAEGRVVDFVMSEKCAAGSGRFLQIVARVLQVDLNDVGPLSLRSTKTINFTTGCAVFTESEAISRLSEGASKEDILAGVHASIAAKVAGLVKRIGLVDDYAVTGGGAKDIGLTKSIEHTLDLHSLIPEEPQITAALGAALLAQERYAAL